MSDIPDTERAARELEGLGLDVLARALPDGILVLDSRLRIVYASPAYGALHGCPPDRVQGRGFLTTLFPERDRQTVRTYFADVRNGRSEPLLSVGYRADGTELEVEVRSTVVEAQGKRFFVCAVRDVTERQREARQAAALAQAAASVAASDSIEAVLEAISECALAGTRALAAWVTLDDGDDLATWVGAAGVPDGFREFLEPAAAVAATYSDFAQALAAHGVLVYADARQRVEHALGTADVADALKSFPWQTAAFARLMHRDTAVGLLTAVYREGVMPYAAETTFLATLASQAATVAADARLLKAAREKVALEERQRLARELVAVREKVTLEERQRLARELHDSVSQSLYAIQLGAKMARERLEQDPARATHPIDYVTRLAEASQAEMRALIFALRPEALETGGLVAALNRQIEAVRARHGLAAQLVGSTEPALPLEVKQALHQIAREALWNTVKHARARRVDVRLEADGDSVVLEVADDGVGFDPEGSFPGHLGLRSMHERATGVGGSLEVVSASGRGTRVVVSVPAAPPGPPHGERPSRSLPRRHPAAPGTGTVELITR